MKPNIELSEKSRRDTVMGLNALLADEFVLGTSTRKCHWNVTGRHFHDLHELFDKQYEALDGIVDDVAERARALGGHAIGTLSEFIKLARLKEHPGAYPGATEMVAELLAGHEKVIRRLRLDVAACSGKLGDVGSADFLTGLMERHEKMAWMLRSFLEEKSDEQANGAVSSLTYRRK